MQKVEKSISIKTTPDKVYAYLKDPNRLSEWMASLSEVRNIEGEGVGQTYEWTYRMLGVPLDGNTTVLEDVANEHIKTETKGGVVSTWVFDLSSDGDTTTLTLGIEYTVPVPVLGKLAEKLVISRNRRETETNLANIKEILEAG
ncbi:MAG: SRPBCC family protein [Deltaproteobacteria bacterium]|nr:SRPBCC family protein [Deltaproteobacteria bacterium]MBW2530734.1 SRPBCC family protein [Deltaproteobacteria bacterium]